MRITEIAKMPTTIDHKDPKYLNSRGIHESILRSYQIVEKVKELLRAGTPARVVLDLILDMEGGESGGALVPTEFDDEMKDAIRDLRDRKVPTLTSRFEELQGLSARARHAEAKKAVREMVEKARRGKDLERYSYPFTAKELLAAVSDLDRKPRRRRRSVKVKKGVRRVR